MAGTTGERGSALEKALDILQVIADSKRPIGLAELAESIDLPRPTIHRTLQQLVETGLILRALQKDRYVIGPTLMKLSVNALTSLNATQPIRPILNELAESLQETCNLGVLDQDEVVYIERVEGVSPLRIQLQVGSRVPFHCTAIGKLLVAEQHKNVRTRLVSATPLKQYTTNTLTMQGDLETEFSKIRSQGYSFNNEEYVEGLNAIAVPVSDGKGKTVAALAIHALQVKMDLEIALTYLPRLLENAKRISQAWCIDD